MVNLTESPPPAAEARDESDEKRLNAATLDEENPSTAAADVAADAATEEPEMAEDLSKEENHSAAGQNTQSSTPLLPEGNLDRMIDDWLSANHENTPLRDLLPPQFSATPNQAGLNSDSSKEEEEGLGFASLEEKVLFHVIKCRPEIDVAGLDAMYADGLNDAFGALLAVDMEDVSCGASRWLAMRFMWLVLGAPGTWPPAGDMPKFADKPYDRHYAIFKRTKTLVESLKNEAPNKEAPKQNKNSRLASSHWEDTKKPTAPAPTTVAGTSAAPGPLPPRQQQSWRYHFPTREARRGPASSDNRPSTYPPPQRPTTRMEVMLYDNFSARSKAWDVYGRLRGASYKFGAPPFEIEMADDKMMADLLSCRYNTTNNSKGPTALQDVNEYIMKIDPNVNLEFGHHRRGRANMLVLAINSETRNEVMKYVGAVFEIAVACVKHAQERRAISIYVFFKNREADLKAAATNPQGIARGAAASSQDILITKMIEKIKQILKSTDVIKRGVAMNHFVEYAPSTLGFESKDVPFGSEDFALAVKKVWAKLPQPGSVSSAASWYDDWVVQRQKKGIEDAAKKRAAKKRAAKEQAAKEQADKEQAAKEKAVKEKAEEENASREKAAKEKAEEEKAAKEQAERERARSTALQVSGPIPPTQAPPTFPSVVPPMQGHAWVQQQPAYPQSAPSWQQPQPYQAPPAQWQQPTQQQPQWQPPQQPYQAPPAQWQQQTQQQPQWQPPQQPYQSASAPWQQPPGPLGQYYGPPPPGQGYPGQPPYR